MANAADQLIHTTVRIETQSAAGQGRGSGFFFRFCDGEQRHVPTIVTNKHVVSGAAKGLIRVTSSKDGKYEPDTGNLIEINIDGLENHCVKHPDPEVDIAVLPISPILSLLHGDGRQPFYIPLDMSLVADENYLNDLSAVEDILMVGYPTGLWDSVHNLPIVRRGITATAPYINFDNKPHFLIDCACFPGSSGSPILLYNSGLHVDKKGNTFMGGPRIKLLGILFAGPQFTARGEIEVRPVPTALKPVAMSPIPTNLGICVKAEQLKWFEEHFQKVLAAQEALESSKAASQPDA